MEPAVGTGVMVMTEVKGVPEERGPEPMVTQAVRIVLRPLVFPQFLSGGY